MHVLLIIEGTYPWYRGGVSEWVYQYLHHLPEVDFTVLQVATDEFLGLDPSQALYPITDNVREFIRIPPPDISGNWKQSLGNWYREQEKKFMGSINNHEMVHVTNTGFAGWLGCRISQQEEIPLILTEHAIYWKEVQMGAVALECGYKIPNTIEAKKKVSESFKEIASLTYNTALQVVTVSQSNIPYQRKRGAENIRYIPNGIPESWLNEQKNRADKPVIGWVGRCAEMKNPLAFFDLVKAFWLMDCNPVFTMLLSDASEHSLQKEVVRTAKQYPEVEVIWNQSAKEYFDDFDFLLITSHNESQPLVMLEALAHKALPVGHKVGDLTRDYGLVFEASASSEAMAEEMLALWQQPEKFELFVEERFSLIMHEHTWPQIFDSYKKLLLELTHRVEDVE